MIKLFTGWDEREAIGWNVFVNSVLSRSSDHVSIIPLLQQYQGDGSNAFTYSRFLIPAIKSYEGWAIFADGCDMVCLGDIAELWKMRNKKYAVQVVKHEYKTKDKIKYRGTEMECANVDYERKNWSSLMLINCSHRDWLDIGPMSIFNHKFENLLDEDIGELNTEWNWLCDEYGGSDDAKILHWTCGIPGFKEYRDTPMAEKWFEEYTKTQRGYQLER